jgi:hypothetical protein
MFGSGRSIWPPAVVVLLASKIPSWGLAPMLHLPY